jgi:hypothetical protein
MIFSNSKFSGDICAFTDVGNKVKSERMKFTATEAMCKV